MRKILVALAFVFFLCPASNAQSIKTLNQDLADTVGAVDLSTGVTQAQAGTIAQYYCRRYIAGCGPVEFAADQSANWAFTPLKGVVGTSDKDKIFVGKHSGKVLWGKGPALSFLDLLNSEEIAPKPINADGVKVDRPSAAKVKIQFSALPKGSVANARFMKSSLNAKCDQQARRAVEKWRFPSRKRSIELITEVGCTQ